jgi:hypothetical protein
MTSKPSYVHKKRSLLPMQLQRWHHGVIISNTHSLSSAMSSFVSPRTTACCCFLTHSAVRIRPGQSCSCSTPPWWPVMCITSTDLSCPILSRAVTADALIVTEIDRLVFCRARRCCCWWESPYAPFDSVVLYHTDPRNPSCTYVSPVTCLLATHACTFTFYLSPIHASAIWISCCLRPCASCWCMPTQLSSIRRVSLQPSLTIITTGY